MRLQRGMAATLLILLAMLTLCAGCAGDRVLNDARHLLLTGETERGLAVLADAAREHPDNLQYRIEYVRERDRAAARWLVQAEALYAQDKLDEAEAAYQRVLQIDAEHLRARAALAAMPEVRRQREQVNEATALFQNNDFDAAAAKLRPLLQAKPGHREAKNLMRRVSEAQAQAERALPALEVAGGKRITLEFTGASLKAVFDMISRVTGVNFVFDKEVPAELKVTMVVRDSSVDDVIRMVLVTNQLSRKMLNDNTLLIYPNTAAKNKEYQDLVMRTFYIANADVKQTANMIRALVKSRDMFVDENLGLIAIRDTPEAVRLAEKLIATQDLVDSEVTLEVEVLEIADNRLQNLGVRFPDSISFQDPAGITGGAPVTAQRLSDDLVAFVAPPPLVLNLLQQNGDTHLLANPRIRVRNNQEAQVHIGDRVPVVTTTATANVGVASSVTYLDVGLKLNVKPTISLDDEVAMQVKLEVSNITREVPLNDGGLAYQIGTRNVSTNLRLRDGETQVLAGLIQNSESQTQNKVPGLGDFPLIGRLFTNNSTTRSKTEIVLLITPRIVRNLARPSALAVEYYAGTEATPAVLPLSIRPSTAGSQLAIGTAASASAAAGTASVEATAVAATDATPISIDAPAQSQPGVEFVVNLTFAGTGSATFDLAYDPAALALVGPAAAAAGLTPLRFAAAGSVQLRFRVLAKAPISTELRVENLLLQDAAGQPLPASAPPPHALLITP